MGHPQNSPRGLFQKHKIIVGTSFTSRLDTNSTAKALVVSRSTAGLPATDAAGKGLAFIVSAAGSGALAINTTGSTWKYLSVTSVLAT